MKMLKTYDFVSERMKINPITRAELNNAKENVKLNPFNITEKDLIEKLEGYPMGVVVRMLEEAKLQAMKPDIGLLQKIPSAGFFWDETEAGHMFWSDVINENNFDKFFEKYPEYKRYNIN